MTERLLQIRMETIGEPFDVDIGYIEAELNWKFRGHKVWLVYSDIEYEACKANNDGMRLIDDGNAVVMVR